MKPGHRWAACKLTALYAEGRNAPARSSLDAAVWMQLYGCSCLSRLHHDHVSPTSAACSPAAREVDVHRIHRQVQSVHEPNAGLQQTRQHTGEAHRLSCSSEASRSMAADSCVAAQCHSGIDTGSMSFLMTLLKQQLGNVSDGL